MIHISLVLLVLLVHWFADFVAQSNEQAQGKSKDIKMLLSHTSDYSLLMTGFAFFIFLGLGFPIGVIIFKTTMFYLVTFVCHTVTDYYTSRLNSALWKDGRVHDFFVSIGFDQWLHSLQLLLTLYFLI